MSTALLRCALGDLPILGGSMRLPTSGACPSAVWSAVVDVHAEADLVDLSPASIVLTRESGAEDRFVGAVRKSARNDGRADLCVTVVAGRGKFASTIPARDYDRGTTTLPVGLLVAGIVRDAGELLADGVAAALDLLTVPHWHRAAGPGSAALDLLCGAVGLVWRFLPAGRVWAGLDVSPSGPDLRRLGFDLEDGARRYGPDGGQILPGQMLEGRRIVDVVYQLGGPLRAEARAVVPGDLAHKPSAELYTRSWSATVVAQDATTGLLELACDDARMGELRGVPLRCGVPGARLTYTTPKGERVRLSFEASDPRQPYAEACDQVDALATVRGVARVGDAVDCGYLTIVDGVLVVAAPPHGPPPPGVVHVTGTITSGSPELQIR